MKNSKLTVKYLLIKGDTFEVWERFPPSNGFYTVLENATLEIDKDKVLTVEGNKVMWDFALKSYPCTDPKDYEDSSISWKLRIQGFFKLKLVPYVKTGWHILRTKEPYKMSTNRFYIIW